MRKWRSESFAATASAEDVDRARTAYWGLVRALDRKIGRIRPDDVAHYGATADLFEVAEEMLELL